MKTVKHKLNAAMALICAGGALSSPAVYAQLEEVVVTAQKRMETVTDVPLSISAVQSDQLQNAGLSSSSQLGQMVPALRVDFSGAYMQPTIRGVGSALAGTGFSTNVASYVDGFYNPNQLTTDAMFLNLESVQVLKGPQGTLFGRNATGGAILMKLRDPSFDPKLSINGSYAKFNASKIGFYGSTGVTDTLAVDLGFVRDKGDGFTDNIYNGKKHADSYDNYSVRSTALWQPAESMSFKLALQHSRQDDGRPYATSVLFDKNRGGAATVGAMIPGTITATERGDVASSSRTRFISESTGVYLTASFDLDFAELISYTQYRKDKVANFADWDASSAAIFEGSFFGDRKTVTQEFNLTGTADKLDYVLGAYYYDSTDSQDPFMVSVAGTPAAQYYSSDSVVKSWALFADGTYELADQWYLTAGIRYSQEKGEAEFLRGPAGLMLTGGVPIAGEGEPYDETWNNVSGRLGLRYQLTDASNIYFMFSQGYKSGLLTPNSFDTKPLDPEKLASYELGYKYAGDRVRLDASVFYYDYKDLQVANYVNGGTAIYRNAATSTIYGVETQLTLAVTEGLQVNTGLSYTRAKYDDFPNAPAFLLDSASGQYVPTDVDASGVQMQRAPKWTFNLGAQYETPLPVGTLKLSGNYYYTSKFPFDNAGVFYQDAYDLLNLKAAWLSPDKQWEVGVFGTNVLNEKYLTQLLPQPTSVQQTYGEPASYGVSVSYTY